MRRGIKFSKRAYIILAITALFNLLSIVFDQLVVQQEDKIRIFDRDISIHKLETNSLLYSHKVFDELMFKVHFIAASMIGDLNSDGIVNILDVVMLVNIVLDIDPINWAGDLNADSIINVLDVIMLINIILDN